MARLMPRGAVAILGSPSRELYPGREAGRVAVLERWASPLDGRTNTLLPGAILYPGIHLTFPVAD